MKLVLCLKCEDIFNLQLHEKTCSCGNVTAFYLKDGLHANIIVKEEKTAIPIGFNNISFLSQLIRQQLKANHDQKKGDEFEAFFIPLLASTISIFQEK